MYKEISKPENLNEIAYRVIKEAILKKKLEPGSRLVDSQLAEQFGISRTPVRDAIRLLLLEGLVENRGDKGYYVFRASETDINEIFDMRLMIDKYVINKIITEYLANNYDHYIKKIDEIIDSVRVGSEYVETEFIKYDEQFHSALISMTCNSRLIRIYEELTNQTRMFREFTAYNDSRVKAVVTEHKNIAKAIKACDLNCALEMVDTHIRTSREYAFADMRGMIF